MQQFGTSLARLDWDTNAPSIWAALSNNDKAGDITQVGDTDPKSAFKRFYDGNAKSWASDVHPNGTEPSTWVSVIDYDSSLLELKITFRDGTTCLYKDISPDMAKSFSEAPSKGRWVHENLVVNHHDYKVVHAGPKAKDIDLYHTGGLLKNKPAQSNGMKPVVKPTRMNNATSTQRPSIGGDFDDYLDNFFEGLFEGFKIQ